MKVRGIRYLVAAAALGALVLPGAVLANEGGNPAEHVSKRIEHLKEKLSLTDDQVQKVRGILESAQAANKAAWEAMQQRKEQTDQQILGVLNDEQKAKYAKMQEKRKEKWQERKEKGSHHWWHKDKKEKES